MLEPILALHDISFFSEDKEIISHINMPVYEGDSIVLAGLSGSGKSTILKLLAGLLLPSGGAALYKGVTITNMLRLQNLQFRKVCSFVFQDSALWANQTIYQILELPLRIHFPKMSRLERDIKMNKIVTLVGYKKSLQLRPSSLSAGEQKQIGFARSLMCDPSILLLDECTESLDINATKRFILILRELQKRNVTLVFISHDPLFMRYLAKKVYVLKDNNITIFDTYAQYAEQKEVRGTI